MHSTRFPILLLVSLFFAPVLIAQAPGRTPDTILKGQITGHENNQYLALPFTVPIDAERLTVTFDYTGKEQKTALDLGLFDPQRFRGWSGGNKSSFTLSETDATPSYLPGVLPPGVWKLIVGVPNIRATVVSRYEARIHFTMKSEHLPEGFSDRPLSANAGWYRGDLHMHTAHSDGSCLSQSGAKVPCPLFLTVEAAVKRGLDFIAITDHNATSQYDDERELQPYFDKTLLIPGREITTFQGHANVFGTTRFLDFRVGTAAVPDENTWIQEARAGGAIVSLNHPNAPSGEICMGCGWRAQPPVDLRGVTSIEAINGGISEGPYAGISFWEHALNEGFHLTGVGGSDNHNAPKPLDQPGSIGSPTTVVYASELSVPGILNGIRSGRVFVDLTGSRDKLLDVSATAGSRSASMGGTLAVSAGAPVDFSLHVIACAGSHVEAIVDGRAVDGLQPQAVPSDDAMLHFHLNSAAQAHWVRFDVRAPDEKLELLGNPIYFATGASQ